MSLPIRITDEAGKVILEGEHIHTIPGHRLPTKEELKDYYGIKTKFDKRYYDVCKAVGFNRYVMRAKGHEKLIIVPMAGQFKAEIVQ
jgi:hypothetical protein